MFFDIQKKLQKILQAEIGESGKLEGIQSVNLGDYKELPYNEFPCIFVDFENGNFTGFSIKTECFFNFSIYLYSLKPTANESAEDCNDYCWNDDNGLIPVILSNSGFDIGGQRYLMKIQDLKIQNGIGASNLYLTAIKISLVVKTIKNL